MSIGVSPAESNPETVTFVPAGSSAFDTNLTVSVLSSPTVGLASSTLASSSAGSSLARSTVPEKAAPLSRKPVEVSEGDTPGEASKGLRIEKESVTWLNVEGFGFRVEGLMFMV